MKAYIWTEDNGSMLTLHWQQEDWSYNAYTLWHVSDRETKVAEKKAYFEGKGFEVILDVNPALTTR